MYQKFQGKRPEGVTKLGGGVERFLGFLRGAGEDRIKKDGLTFGCCRPIMELQLEKIFNK